MQIKNRHSWNYWMNMLMFYVAKAGLCHGGVHEIHVTSDFKPQRLKAYKVPELLKPEVARQLQELMDMGFMCKLM